MANKRATDPNGRQTWFRSDRLVRESGKWFFLTREGTVEGPYDSELEANQRMETYASVMSSQVIGESAALKG